MKNIFLAILFICAYSSAVASNNVVATVNNELITNIDVEKKMSLLLMSIGGEVAEDDIKIIYTQALDALIEEKLLIHQAKIDKIDVDDQAINSAIDALAAKDHLKAKQLEEVLKAHGSDFATFRSQVQSQLIWNEIVQKKLLPSVLVTKDELANNINSIKKELSVVKSEPTSYGLSEIVLNYTKGDTENKGMLADQLVRKLKDGGDFAKIARQFSESMSSNSGGYIGALFLNQMSPELETALKKAKIGDIIGPLKLQDYFYIVRVEKIDKVKPNSKFEEVNEDQVKQILIQKKLSNLTRAYIKKLREKAYISIKNFAEKR